jgi:hypothetical protein
MKFAGPSMGAALGSGVMSGMQSAQETAAKDELARDQSAMATYSKLVSSGEWEPVGEKGVADGGVLRVGNVGFLRKVSRPPGVDWDAQKAMSLMQYRRDQTRQADERLAKQKSDKGPFVVYVDKAGNQQRVYEKDKLPGPGWTRELGVNLLGIQATDNRADQREDVGFLERRLTDIDGDLKAGAVGAVKDFLPDMIKGKPILEKAYKERQRLLRERTHVLGLLESTVGRSTSRVRRRTPFQTGSGLDDSLNKYEAGGASAEDVSIAKRVLKDPKDRGILEGILNKFVETVKDFDSTVFWDSVVRKFRPEKKKSSTPFSVEEEE